jgi:hypothetical protein
MPLLQSVAGPLFPKPHSRKYVQRLEDGTGAVLMDIGNQVPYDATAELVFDIEEACEKCFAYFQAQEVLETMAEDEEQFLDKNIISTIVIRESCLATW